MCTVLAAQSWISSENRENQLILPRCAQQSHRVGPASIKPHQNTRAQRICFSRTYWCRTGTPETFLTTALGDGLALELMGMKDPLTHQFQPKPPRLMFIKSCKKHIFLQKIHENRKLKAKASAILNWFLLLAHNIELVDQFCPTESSVKACR